MKQQSQKRGIRSDAQKQDRAREGYDPIPPANPVAGAFGEHQPDTPTDQEVSFDKAPGKSKNNVGRNDND